MSGRGHTHTHTEPLISSTHPFQASKKKTYLLHRFALAKFRLFTLTRFALFSGALAGNPFNIDREFVASELGFAEATRNSLDATGDREFVRECSAILRRGGMCASRLRGCRWNLVTAYHSANPGLAGTHSTQ